MNNQIFLNSVRDIVFSGQFPTSDVEIGLQQLLTEFASIWPTADNKVIAFAAALFHYETTRKFIATVEPNLGVGKLYGYQLKRSAQSYSNTSNLFYGRGIIRLAWYENYELFGNLLNINLIDNPELALELNTAIKIMLLGIKDGLFTGYKITDYLDTNITNWDECRNVVMVGDKDVFFVKLCLQYLEAITIATI